MFRVEWGIDENPMVFNYAYFEGYKQAENFYNKKEDELNRTHKDEGWVNLLTNDPEEAQDYDAEYVPEFQEPESGYESYDLHNEDKTTTDKYVPFTIYLYTDKWDEEFKKLEHHFEYMYEGSGSYYDVVVEDCTQDDDPCVVITGQIAGVESLNEFHRDLGRGVADYNINDWDAKLSLPDKNSGYMNEDQIRLDYERQVIDYDKACNALITLLDISRGDAQGIVDGWEIIKSNDGLTAAERLYNELKDYEWVGDDENGPPGNICEWGADDDEVKDCVETFISGYVEDKILDTQIEYTDDNTNIKATVIFEDNSQAILNFFKTDDSWCFDTKDFGGTKYNRKVNVSKSCEFLKRVLGK